MIPENPTFPFTITKRNGKATIYRRDKVKGTGTYPEYRLAFYDSAGKRHLESFSEFPTALKTANARLDALLQGTADVLTLSGSQRLDYLQATKLLPPGVTLTEAVKGYQRLRRADDVTAISVSDLVAEFIQTRTNQTQTSEKRGYFRENS